MTSLMDNFLKPGKIVDYPSNAAAKKMLKEFPVLADVEVVPPSKTGLCSRLKNKMSAKPKESVHS